jgi:hypothetical protein
MQTDLCDNCKTPAGEGDEGHAGWVKMAKFDWHEGAHEELPPQLRAILAAQQGGGEIPRHLCPKTYDLCSDRCAALFLINGYKPNLEGLFADLDSLTPQDFVDATQPPDADKA